MQAPLRARRCQASTPTLVRPVVSRPSSCVSVRSMAVESAVEGDVMWNKSYYPKGSDTSKLNKDWFLIDAAGQPLGRLACLAAKFIRGKHAPTYTPSMDMGAMLIVVNAEKVAVSGAKFTDKLYKRHVNGLPGSMKQETFRELQARYPEKIIEKAVFGMLPKGRLGNRIKLNMKIYKGGEHPHEAQQPVDITDKIDQPF